MFLGSGIYASSQPADDAARYRLPEFRRLFATRAEPQDTPGSSAEISRRGARGADRARSPRRRHADHRRALSAVFAGLRSLANAFRDADKNLFLRDRAAHARQDPLLRMAAE